MRTQDEKIIAILLADIHLSLKPPIWRSAEQDWLKAQCRVLKEVRLLQSKYKCPILCAGDIFDRWNCAPELINYALSHLPKMYAIPGQHDLPYHRIDDINKSAFWTLVEAGKIEFLSSEKCLPLPGMTVYGFPYQNEVTEKPHPTNSRLSVAIIHDYIWMSKHHYPNPPKEKQIDGRLASKLVNKKLYGYDIIVFGDNHDGFLTRTGKTTIFNCGTLIRRKSDEIDYKPQVGLLTASGKVIRQYLNTSKDKYLSESTIDTGEDKLDAKEFIRQLEELGETSFDFTEAIKEFFLKEPNLNPQVKEIILKAME